MIMMMINILQLLRNQKTRRDQSEFNYLRYGGANKHFFVAMETTQLIINYLVAVKGSILQIFSLQKFQVKFRLHYFHQIIFSSKEKYSHKSVSRRRNNYRQYTTSTTASSELPLSTSPDDSAVEETIYTGASGPNITGSLISFYTIY